MMPVNQESTNLDSIVNLPSFSIVYETANLATVELDNIYQSLKSLAEQDISPAQANEFLIIDGGDAPSEVIDELCLTYPWITVRQVPSIKYHEAKMIGARMATGDIVVICDSDCVYFSSWLSNILTFFQENPDTMIVAGETSTLVRNPYELAIAIHYIFPRFSENKSPYPSNHYLLNSVAFRRDFLLQYPIPTNTSLYRGNCMLHAHFLCNLKGHRVWKHPRVRAFHEPPTAVFAFWRYLLKGRDQVIRKYIMKELLETFDLPNFYQLENNIHFSIFHKLYGISSTILRPKLLDWNRILSVLQEEPSRLIFLPLAFPIVLWFELLHRIGSIITFLEPDFLLKLYEKFET